MGNIITIENDGADRRTQAFAAFMSDVENEMNSSARKDSSLYKDCTPTDLEKEAVRIMKTVAPKTEFDPNDIELVSKQYFPDILLSKRVFGVEVKSTQSNHWTSTGSSIVESTRNDYVKCIYMLFGKLGGSPAEFKCRPYEDCLYDIAVTHSPRYLIDMNLKKSETIFSKMHTTYEDLRTASNSIEQVRKYYRDKAIKDNKKEMPWWLGTGETITSQMNVRLWQDAKSDILKAKMFVLFPEVLNSEFANVALWLCTEHSIVVYNARDAFTAGGRCTAIGGEKLQYPIPHIVGSLLNSSTDIKRLFNDEVFLHSELSFYRQDLFEGYNCNFYKKWLDKTNERIQNLEYEIDKTKRNLRGVPFIDWFESGAKAIFKK
ncbi:MAG: hypothetical protein IKW77_12055 [Salinivirgaceae bacterium]|nr:hypothetical protein [Salinivirgaceae bacterium]